MEYTIENFLEEKFAVEIKTEEEHKKFCKLIKETRVHWFSGNEIEKLSYVGKAYMCVQLGGNTYLGCDPVSTFTGKGIPVISLEKFVEHNRKPNQVIVIYTDGKTTTALMKDGKNIVKKAEAKCSPEDEFDFATGACIAFDRLLALGRNDPVGPEGAVGASQQPFVATLKPEVQEIKRPAKDGEYVKMVKNLGLPYCKVGDIAKCISSAEVFPGLYLAFLVLPQGGALVADKDDYVILEGYKPEVEEK